MRVVCAGIGTEIGKTYASAMLCKSLNLAYFKIVQAGEPTDSDLVKSLFQSIHVYKDGIRLKTPASPHLAKTLEKREYKLEDILIPDDENLLLECAGGLYSPLDDDKCMIDFIAYHKLSTFLVASEYLGSINHTILSIEALRRKDIPIKGLILRGEDKGVFASTADFISRYCKINPIWLPFFDQNNKEEVLASFKKELLQKSS